LQSRYVTPVADPRLNKTRRFTLAAPLSASMNDTEITVHEPTDDVVMYAPCRILQFGGELVSYESYTAAPPYKFLGVKRGAHKTRVAAHPHGEVGGILDISEFGAPMSCYADQNTGLQDEVAAKLARAYNCGFEYVYLDGSEGVNRPFNYHVANAQLRYWKLLTPEPSFGEGAAKTHFGWHMLAGANAFDTFPPEVFKAKLREFPFKQAPITQQDMSRVDFGWWAFCSPSGGARPSVGTQADMWEYGASVAAAWDCAISILMPASALKRHPRADDILEMMRRWGDCRRRGLFKDEWRPRLKNYAQEHHLVVDAKGDYDLVDYWPLAVGNGQTPVRAFVFSKDGATWVVYWHGSGEGRLRLPIEAGAAALYEDFAGKPVAFEKDGESITVPATKRLYLKTTLARDAAERAFAAAALLPPGNAPFLGFNEDDTHYYGRADRVNPDGFRKYIDDIGRGKVTDFFICANAQRSIISSKVFDSAWKDKPDPAGYGLNLKNLEATGTDAIRLWIETCRAKGIRPWVSMRMNDIHDVDDFDHPLHSSFWRNHPECWVVPGVGDLKNSTGCWRSLDYAQKPVYDYHLAFVKELIDRYGDAEGIELDWLRGVYCLTRGKQNDLHPVLTRFMRDVRAYASAAGEKRGRKIRVAARVPSDPDAAASYGFRPVEWAKEGVVDVLIPCNHYGCSDFLLPYRDWCARLAAVNPAVQVVPGTDSGIYFLGAGGRRMMTLDEYYGWADGLFAEGARDLYLFNLYENPPDSVAWNEILSHGFDAAKVAAHRRRYAITYRDVPGIRPDYGNLLPANWAKGVELTVRVGTPPKTGGKVAVLAAFDGAAPDDFAARVALNGVSPIGGAPEPPANWLNGTKANMNTVKQSADPQFGYLPQNVKSSMRYAFPSEAVQRGTNAFVVKPAGEGSLRLMCLELEIAP
ncbi:MAG TPA: hypothetical protein PKI32_04575, partial [Opitutales bacterium]|nr:hypothetical protein [Opitutales bacterium]